MTNPVYYITEYGLAVPLVGNNENSYGDRYIFWEANFLSNGYGKFKVEYARGKGVNGDIVVCSMSSVQRADMWYWMDSNER